METMPWPRRIEAGVGRLPLIAGGWEFVGTTTPRLVRAAGRLRDQVAGAARAQGHGCRVTVACAPAAEFPALDDDERYRLATGPGGVQIEAASEWGVLRAFATLVQLVRGGPDDPSLPVLTIDDAPRFAWRGLMVDTARHFIGIKTLEHTLDAMALFKLNVLHLHLSDDQAFRFRSHAYPELAEPHPAYAPAELRALVRAAADRGIRIVPELDVPGHVASWLAVHPEWGIGETIAAPTRRFGVHSCCLDPNSPDAVQAALTLFGELAEIFPDRFVHFGGDEVHLPDGAETDGLQAAFNTPVVARLRALGKSPIAWDEAVHPGLSPEVAIQSWRGPAARSRALAAGFDTLHSAPYYLDLFYPADLHYLADPELADPEPADPEHGPEPDLVSDPRLAHVRPGLETLQALWASDAAATRATRRAGRVLGGEACMWTELVTEELLPLRVWSRMPAIAERFWSDVSVRDVDDMYRRLAASHDRLARTGIADLAATTDRGLAQLGLSAADRADLAPLIDVLEPVKWYARLLGPATMAQRAARQAEDPSARPYDTKTGLTRVVDLLPPESFAARRLAAETEVRALRATAGGWRRQRACVRRLARRHPEIAELDGVSAALQDLADRMERHLDGHSATVPAAALRPHGEYILAVAAGLADRFAG